LEAALTIDIQPWMERPATRAVMAALTAGGGTPRFVGGCVRDAVLGRSVRDVDIATDDPPDRVMTLLGDAGIKAIPTGIDHGTVTAVADGHPFEITTLRQDVETDGRRAVVAFTDDWKIDAARRDFTMNALYCDGDGTLYDPVGGLADLRAGRVRFVGDAHQRIEEDVLRLLRFFRFYAHYGTVPADAEALAACAGMAPRIPGLSVERVWSELKRLLLAPDPASVFDLMAAHGVLAHVLPEAGDREVLSRLAVIDVRNGFEPDAVRRLASLLHGDPAGLAKRLKMSKAERARLTGMMVSNTHPDPEADSHTNRVALYRLGKEIFTDLVLLGMAKSDGDWDRLLDDLSVPVFPLGGREVLALGVQAGEQVGEQLAAIETWWIEQDFEPDAEACRARLRERIGAGQN
jgi:poly(A) polymerase